MAMTNNRNKYGWMAVLLHWLLFLLIAGLMASGNYSDALPRDEKVPQLIGIHKQVGVAVLMLMLFRLLWRLVNTSVESLAESGFVSFLAWANHWLLYLVVMAQAGIGVLMSQISGRAVSLFGWELPLLVGERGLLGDPDFIPGARELRTWHTYGGYAILLLVGLHFLGALMHHFGWGDETLKRMWFGYKPPFEKEAHARRH